MTRQFLLFTFLLFTIISCQPGKSLYVLMYLPQGDNIPVIIKRSDLNNIVTDKIPVFYHLDQPIPAQIDDLDHDGLWDEIALSVSTRKDDILALSVKWEDRMPDFPIRTNIRMGVSVNRDYNFKEVSETIRPKDHVKEDPPRLYQMEGPAWENDIVGFRSYFDTRNGKDIFGKRIKSMVLDTVGLQKGNYHVISDWGMDILKVGNSLGAGALGVAYKDSLYRLENTQRVKFKILCEGAVRSVFELKYEGWNVDDLKLDLTERISIWAGRYGYQSDVIVNGTTNRIQLVTGIVNLNNDTLYKREIDSYKYWAIHDKQSENKDALGMAIFTKKGNLVTVAEAPENGNGITQTYYGTLNCIPGKPVSFWFVCGWQMTNSNFMNENYFLNVVEKEINAIKHIE